MGKKKKEKKKGKKKSKLNYRLIVIVGGIFHFITYLLFEKTLENSNLFYLSLIIGGLGLGLYFIKKMELTNPKSYRKLEGNKLKSYIFFICFMTILGATAIFGNVINGTILGLNYLGKSSQTETKNFTIEKITRYHTSGRKRMFRNNPKVYFTKGFKTETFILPEHFSSKVNYSEYKTIELTTSKGLLGFEYIENYYLKK